jgi:hypothetical protein
MLLSHYAVDLGALFQKHYPPPKQYQTLAEPSNPSPVQKLEMEFCEEEMEMGGGKWHLQRC